MGMFGSDWISFLVRDRKSLEVEDSGGRDARVDSRGNEVGVGADETAIVLKRVDGVNSCTCACQLVPRSACACCIHCSKPWSGYRRCSRSSVRGYLMTSSDISHLSARAWSALRPESCRQMVDEFIGAFTSLEEHISIVLRKRRRDEKVGWKAPAVNERYVAMG